MSRSKSRCRQLDILEAAFSEARSHLEFLPDILHKLMSDTVLPVPGELWQPDPRHFGEGGEW